MSVLMIERTQYIHTVLRLAISGALVFLIALAARADVTLISEVPGPNAPLVRGSEKEANEYFTTASTFKPIITLAAFELGKVTPTTKVVCNDDYLPVPKPAMLDLQKAMYYSSNEFFAPIARDVGSAALLKMAERCGFGKSFENPPDDPKKWTHGGPIRVTPMQEHLFARRLATNQLPVDPKIQDMLRQAMMWPPTKNGREVYGKTGSMSGVFWFNGFCRDHDRVRVITVLLQGEGASREQAIRAFYDESETPFLKR